MTIDQRLREASAHVHQAADQIVEPALRQKPPRRLRFAPALTALATAVALLIPLLWVSNGTEPDRTNVLAPAEPGTTQPSPDETAGEVPAEVLAYRSLEGTLLSSGSEPGWLCPASPWGGYRSAVPDSEIPANLILSAPAGLENISEHRGSNGGPNCHQPVSLVLLGANGGAAIWPSVTRFPEECATDPCVPGGDNATPPTSMVFTGSIEHPTINGHEALLHGWLDHSTLWFEDPAGVPLYLEASGLTSSEIIALAGSVVVDVSAHTVSLSGDTPSDLTVAEQRPSVGYWITDYAFGAKYQSADSSIYVDTSFGGHSLGRQETPLSIKASFGAGIELVDLGDRQAVWNPGGERYLTYLTDDGVTVTVSGFTNVEDAIAFALNLK